MAAKNTHPVSVVTGGAGFLGSHLVDRLLTEGHRVIAIDNLITGNTANIGHLAGNENFRFIKHNVSNFIFLPEEKIDYVFHFASPASPIDYLELPIPTLKVGALGTHNTLGLAKDKRASFILASTSEVYGDPLEHPQKEDYWQTRSFCYVSDLIDGIFKLAMSNFHEPVNLGNPREMTIKQFADEIIRITGTKSAIGYKPLPVDDPKVRQPDISRAKEVLGWEPCVEFEEGIKKTIEYFSESLNR